MIHLQAWFTNQDRGARYFWTTRTQQQATLPPNLEPRLFLQLLRVGTPARVRESPIHQGIDLARRLQLRTCRPPARGAIRDDNQAINGPKSWWTALDGLAGTLTTRYNSSKHSRGCRNTKTTSGEFRHRSRRISLSTGETDSPREELASDDEVARRAIRRYDDPDNLMIENGLLCSPEGQILVPHNDELRMWCISQAHDSMLAGYFGVTKTLEKVWRQWI